MFKLQRARKLSPLIIGLPKRLFNAFFGLSGFHNIPFSSKAYCVDIVIWLNARTGRHNVVEIGCGLGDIIRRLEYNVKCGLDKKDSVLRALRFLKHLHFWVGGNRSMYLGVHDVNIHRLHGTWDVIILVNWVHNLEPSRFQNILETMYNDNLATGGEIVIDLISDVSVLHAYAHNLELLLKNIRPKIVQIGSYTDHNKLIGHMSRSVVSIQKN